jgi:hypothetical protein
MHRRPVGYPGEVAQQIASTDWTVRIWEPMFRSETLVPRGHASTVTAVARQFRTLPPERPQERTRRIVF